MSPVRTDISHDTILSILLITSCNISYPDTGIADIVNRNGQNGEKTRKELDERRKSTAGTDQLG